MSLCPEASREESSSSSTSFITPEDEETTTEQEVGQPLHDQEVKRRLQERLQHQKTSLVEPSSEGVTTSSLLSIQDSKVDENHQISESSCLLQTPRPASNTSCRSLDPKSISTADVDPEFLLDYRPETVDFPESPRILSPSSLHVTSRQQHHQVRVTSMKFVC